MELRRILVIGLLAFIAAACSGLAGEPEIVATIAPQPTHVPLEVDDPAQLGQVIYATRCASCHGLEGRGDGEVLAQAGGVAPDFTNPATASSQTIQQWTDTIRYGRLENLMPPWEDALSAEEIDAVAQYTYTMWEDAEPLAIVADEAAVDTTTISEVMGTVSGEITQGTTNAAPPASLSLGLHVLDAERQQVSFFTYELTDGLSYRFEDVPIRNDYNYLVSVIYADAAFASESVIGTPDTPNLNLPVTIYETTDDPTNISVDMQVMLLLPEGDMLVVQQFMSFANHGDRVYRSPDAIDDFTHKSIAIPLPAGATLLNGDILGERFVLEEDGPTPVLYDTQGVVPSSNHVVEVLYTLPLTTAEQLSVALPYNLDNPLEILSPAETLTVSAANLVDEGARQFNFGTFTAQTLADLSAGDRIDLQIESALMTAPLTTQISSFDWLSLAPILLVAGMTLITASVVFLLVGQRKNSPTQADILAQITDLDARYEAGELDETTYQQQRQALKRQLAELIPTTAV